MSKFVGEGNRQRLVTEDETAPVLIETREVVLLRRAVSELSSTKMSLSYFMDYNSKMYLYVYIDIILFQNQHSRLPQKMNQGKQIGQCRFKHWSKWLISQAYIFFTQYKNTKFFIRYIKMI